MVLNCTFLQDSQKCEGNAYGDDKSQTLGIVVVTMVTIINIFPVFIENTFVSNYHFTIITHKHPIIYNYALIYVNWPRTRKGPVMQVTYPNKHKVLLKCIKTLKLNLLFLIKAGMHGSKIISTCILLLRNLWSVK